MSHSLLLVMHGQGRCLSCKESQNLDRVVVQDLSHINIHPLTSSSIFLLTNYTNSKTQQMPTLMMIVTTPQSMKILPQTYLMVTKTEDSLIFC